MTCEPATIEHHVVFTNPVLMGFDPQQLQPGDPVREVFADHLARTIWLSWRPRHIVNHLFADEVVMLASIVRAAPPSSAEELARIVRQRFGHSNFRSSLLDQWAAEVFPYINGKHLSWTLYRPEAE
jgi:hypothetical protein